MPFVLGIDVGTTYTAAALSRDGRAEVIGLESHRVTVPSVVFADGDNVVYGTAAESRGATNPAGMAREFKRRLGDPVPIVLSGSPYSADRLVALFVRWVVDSVTAQIGEAPARVVVTHPANWTEFQLHLLSTALEQVDLGGVGLLSEPQAAAHDFGAVAHLASGDRILVYDLGGGTFDVALLQRDERGFSHVGAPAGIERLGGIDFDEAIFQRVVAQIPAEVIDGARGDNAGRMALAQLRRACIEAKEALSSEDAVEVPVMLPGHSSTVRITRTEFEGMIRPMLGQTIERSQQVLANAELAADQLSAVLLVGGSSRIPLVAEMVRAALGVPVRIDAHPKLVVARGAARWAADLSPATLLPATVGANPARRGPPVAVVAGVLLAVAAIVFTTVLTLRDHNDEPAADDVIVNPSAPTETTAPTSQASGTTSPAAATTSPGAATTGAPADTTTPAVGTTAPPPETAPVTTPVAPPPNVEPGRITRSSWSGDGLRLALGRDDGSVRMVDAETGDTLFTLEGQTGAVRDIPFNRGRLATTSDDGTVRVWNAATGDALQTLSGHTGPVTTARWNVEGTLIATASDDGTSRIFDVSTGESLATLDAGGEAVAHVAWSRDSNELATVGQDNIARIWDAASGELRLELTGHGDRVTDVAWSPAGDTLVTAGDDGTARVWDAASGAALLTFEHNGPVTDVSWARGSDRVLTSSLDGTAVVWDASSGAALATLGADGDPGVVTASWSDDESLLVTGSEDGAVALWDGETGEAVRTLDGHTDAVTVIVWSEQGRLVTTSDDGTSRVWDGATGDELLELAE